MTMKASASLRAFFVLALLCGGVVYAQGRPEQDINPDRHPNLAEAQRLIGQAWDKVVEAQHANDWDMQHHAEKARDLLDQASHELSEAARDANRH
jgi:hypothetical protein